MQLRVDQLVPYGYTDSTIATFHAFGDRLDPGVRVRAGAAVGRARPVAAGDRDLPARASVRFRAGRLPAARRSHAVPGGARLAVQPLQGRGRSARRRTWPTRSGWPRRPPATALGRPAPMPRRRPDAADALAEVARRQLELARAYARYQQLLHAHGFIDFGDQVSLALRLAARSRPPRARRSRRASGTSWWTSSRTRTGPRRSSSSLLADRHRNVTVVGDDDQSIYAFRGAAVSNILEFAERHRSVRERRAAPQLPVAGADPRGEPSAHPLQRSGPAGGPRRHQQGSCGRSAGDATPPPVRRRGVRDGRRGGGLDRRARSGDASRPARGRGTTRSSSGRTPPRTRSCAASTCRASRGGSRARPGCTRGPRCGCCWRSCGRSRTSSSSVDVYALAASEVYGLGGEDLTAIVNSARRRNRSLWEVLEELERQPGLLRISPGEPRRAVARLVADLRALRRARPRAAGRRGAVPVPAGLGLARRGSRRQTRSRPTEALPEHRPPVRDRPRASRALLADDRAVFVARHLQTLIEAGDDPPSAEIDPEADAVAVLTVHKAKGLEFPVVFMPGLVAGRFPAVGRRDPLDIPLELVRDRDRRAIPQLQEERRLFYVGMTRARDELILSHAADYGGSARVASRRSCWRRWTCPRLPGRPGVGAQRPAPLERIAAFEPRPRRARARRRADRRAADAVSFGQIDDYLTCPRKYSTLHVLRVPVAPHHAMIYGSALHKAVQEFHRRHARGDVMSEERADRRVRGGVANEGFLTREHEEARLEAGRAALRRFREEQLQPGRRHPGVRRARVLVLPRAATGSGAAGTASTSSRRARRRPPRRRPTPATAAAGGGRAVMARRRRATCCPPVPRERVTITDYKSSDVRDPAGRASGRANSLQLHDLRDGVPGADRAPARTPSSCTSSNPAGRPGRGRRATRSRRRGRRSREAAAGIRARDFTPGRTRSRARYCPFRDICPSSAAR